MIPDSLTDLLARLREAEAHQRVAGRLRPQIADQAGTALDAGTMTYTEFAQALGVTVGHARSWRARYRSAL